MNSLFPLMEKQEELQEGEDTNLKLYIFSSSSQVVASSSSSQLAFATCFRSATQHDVHQTMNLHHHHHHLLQESHHQLQRPHNHQAEKSIGGSREDSSEVMFSSSTRETFERSRSDHTGHHQEQQLDEDRINKQDRNGSAPKYWMSSKMRLMQRMMVKTDKKINGGANSDQKAAATSNINNNNNNHGRSSSCNSNYGQHNNNGVRVCSDCNTTTTPLWRSGPQGPKSLCNACGIRQRKARRAMAEAANGGGDGETPSGKEVLHKEKKSRLSCHGEDGFIVADRVKNKCNKNNKKNNNNNSRECEEEGVSFDGHNFTLRLSKSGSAFGKVFPRDEEEAAILLMELSCGLVHSC